MNLDQPMMDDLPHTEWKCELCGAGNSCFDGDCQFCDGPEPEPAKPPFYCVAVYLTDRAYGGPEEGGWYYDCGQRIDDIQECPLAQPVIFGNELEAEAIDYCQRVNKQLHEGLNKERRSDTSSVLSEGRYVARITEGYPEPHFPAERPRYE